MNLKLIEQFRDYLFNVIFTTKIKDKEITQHYKINYIDKKVSTFKFFITEAIEAGFIQKFTWNGLKSERREVVSVYTDFTQIQSFINCNLTDL